MTTDGLLSVTNWVYLLSLFVAAVASVGLWRLSIASSEEKDRQLEQYKTDKADELERYKTDADTRIAQANERAGKANEEAARANERAGKLEKDAEELRRSNLLLQQQIEATRKTGERIEKTISPRHLSIDQNRSIFNELSSRAAGKHISITLLGDAEANAYGREIVEALQRSGIEVVVNSVGAISTSGDSSIDLVGITAGPGCDPEIKLALQHAGIEVKDVGYVSRGSAMMVGLKQQH